MTPIKEQIEFAKQRHKEAKETSNHDEEVGWKCYLQGLEYAKIWYESQEGKKELKELVAKT